jgi:hypothetical protein
LIARILHEKLGSVRARLLGFTIAQPSCAAYLGILLLANGCRAEPHDPASSELIRAKPGERAVPELICLVQSDASEVLPLAGNETPALPSCNSRIRDQFLRNLSRGSSSSNWAEVAETDIPKKGRFYWGLLPGIDFEVFIRAVSHGPKKGKATHYLHPVTGHWMAI